MYISDKNVQIYSTNNLHVSQMYNKFKREFKHSHYLIEDRHDFIKIFVDPLLENILMMDDNQDYYRARINNTIPYNSFSDDDLRNPPSKLVNDGRFNPKGISYLYLSSNELTAIKEVRPKLNDKVGIAKCRPLQSLKIIDLYKENHNESANDFRKKLSDLFSMPVKCNDIILDYRPTQYIAEYLKREGFDGVRYQSSINPNGQNICVFKPNQVKVSYLKEVVYESKNIFENV